MWIFVTIGAVLLAISPRWGSGQSNPEEMLAQGVKLSRSCGYTIKRTEFGKKEKKSVKEADNRDKMIKELSLANLFRPGRFRLEFGQGETEFESRPVARILFSPKPEKEHLKASGEASMEVRAVNWGMNRMSGEVLVDLATGGIVSIAGKTPGNQPARKFLIRYAELKALDFSLKQRLVGESWLPETSSARLHVWKIRGEEINGLYVTEFDCTSASAKK